MPIEHRIDLKLRLVVTKVHGTLTDPEIFAYQGTVWSRPEVAGFDELVDMSEVEHIALPSTDRVERLAQVSAHMDPASLPSKLAIFAPTDLAFALGRMYEAYRSLEERSTKQVRVFREMAQALAWLGISGETLE